MPWVVQNMLTEKKYRAFVKCLVFVGSAGSEEGRWATFLNVRKAERTGRFFPLLCVYDTLDMLSEAQWFSTLDLK